MLLRIRKIPAKIQFFPTVRPSERNSGIRESTLPSFSFHSVVGDAVARRERSMSRRSRIDLQLVSMLWLLWFAVLLRKNR